MDGAGELPEPVSEYLDSLELACDVKLPRAQREITEVLNPYPQSETGVQANAEDPAYVAFTSGSTGQPKGVLGKHGPITHFLPWQAEAFELNSSDRFSLLSGLGYNHLHRDIFTALALGAAVYVPAPGILTSADRLGEWLDHNRITVLHLTPALGRLLRMSSVRVLSSVRRIFFGGDVLTKQDGALTRELAPMAKIVSFYGATETQRAVGYFEVLERTSTSEGTAMQTMPLGRGVKDVQLLILTTGGHLAGIGEIGELYVRSPHLACGYIDDDALTRKTFLINPFTQAEGDRLYKTGDLGRYLPDGNVEWVGRKDRRVSLRGFRVELAEVESVLNQHVAVRESAVVARDWGERTPQDREFDTRLVAYVEGEPGHSPLSIDELRCFLSARLPNYMVPSYFLFLDRMPLSPNGKVDYLKLPSVEQLLRLPDEKHEAPRTEVEQTLGKIFSEVLGLERIGRQESFFHIGGHSLLAAQVAARVRDTLSVALDLRAFLKTPTIAGLAIQVEALLGMTKAARDTQASEREEIEL
jgi:amino acid adenylation domain-containing protein